MLSSIFVKNLFSVAEKARFTGCGKPNAEGGGGFNPRIKPTESTPALAQGARGADFTREVEDSRSLFRSDAGTHFNLREGTDGDQSPRA
jgi:hypothetical protein